MSGNPGKPLGHTAGQIQIRQATAADTSAMLSITQNVWDGNDYLPFIWNEWLRDASGRLTVAALDDQVVGVHHVALLPDGSAWAEGIRVAGNAQGRGIGEALLLDGIEWARSMGASAIRLSTTSRNPASNRIAEKCGLSPVHEYRLWSAPADLTEVGGAVRVAHAGEVEDLWRFLEESESESDFYMEGWTAYRLTRERLRLLLATSTVAVTGRNSTEAMAIATATSHRPTLRLGLIVGGQEGVRTLANWLRERARATCLRSVRGPLLAGRAERDALKSAGYEVDLEHTMVLHERGLHQL